ncbi:MAG TPA: integration host factor subunit alpha [Coxiellaceae bacterium]|nr:integration host factor subunit alpha [Coxiellaceae bacterium]
MAALTKADLAKHLFDKIGINKREAYSLVEDFFEVIRHALASGFEVKISNFGSFCLRNKNERPGRNPKTGKDVAVSARRVVAFKASQQLKELVETRLSDRASKRHAMDAHA